MKINTCLGLLITTALFIFFAFTPAAFSMDDPGFTINRMVVSKDVVDKEPVGVGDFFSAATEKLYCFLEATNIEQDMQVSFVWFWSSQEMARVNLTLQKGNRWRTYSSKKLAGLKGQWKVELQDSSGVVHNSISFTVE
jgi:hypothetical protein